MWHDIYEINKDLKNNVNLTNLKNGTFQCLTSQVLILIAI